MKRFRRNASILPPSSGYAKHGQQRPIKNGLVSRRTSSGRSSPKKSNFCFQFLSVHPHPSGISPRFTSRCPWHNLLHMQNDRATKTDMNLNKHCETRRKSPARIHRPTILVNWWYTTKSDPVSFQKKICAQSPFNPLPTRLNLYSP